LDVQSGVQGVDVLRAEELARDKVSCGFVIWLDLKIGFGLGEDEKEYQQTL
jgi:hypothetical protein